NRRQSAFWASGTPPQAVFSFILPESAPPRKGGGIVRYGKSARFPPGHAAGRAVNRLTHQVSAAGNQHPAARAKGKPFTPQRRCGVRRAYSSTAQRITALTAGSVNAPSHTGPKGKAAAFSPLQRVRQRP